MLTQMSTAGNKTFYGRQCCTEDWRNVVTFVNSKRTKRDKQKIAFSHTHTNTTNKSIDLDLWCQTKYNVHTSLHTPVCRNARCMFGLALWCYNNDNSKIVVKRIRFTCESFPIHFHVVFSVLWIILNATNKVSGFSAFVVRFFPVTLLFSFSLFLLLTLFDRSFAFFFILSVHYPHRHEVPFYSESSV